MVGMQFSKCLQRRNLLKLLLVLTGSSLFVTQAAVASTVTGHPVGVATTPLAVEVAPEAVNFMDEPVGETYTQTVRIMNVGAKTLQIKRMSTSSADFRITGIMLPVVVAHGTSESFTILFHPREAGRKDGQISIFTNSDDEPLLLKAHASIITVQTELTASEAAIDFADVAIGSTGKQEVSLTNVGNREVAISAISVTGQDFSVSGATGMHLSPGQSASVEVNFAPKSTGPQSGQLAALSGEGSFLVLIPLSATGAESSRRAVKLNWEESPVTVAGYVVYRSADSSGPYTRLSERVRPNIWILVW
jgi:Abnormal spindle-like microcephaly-assoc'd, ASPM-SPD-2-Hydin/Transmembrane protein 131-like N-terminal